MKKISALIIFFCFHAFLIFLHVHKQSYYLTLSYNIQKLQNQLNELLKQKYQLTHILYSCQQPTVLEHIAEKNLGMQPITLKDIQKIS